MFTYAARTWNLFSNYVLYRVKKNPSSAQSYWRIPEPINIRQKGDFTQKYLAQKKSIPFYFMDYKPKLTYALKNIDDIIVLNYQAPKGEPHVPHGSFLVPEAAFQFALGLHDSYVETNQNEMLVEFLRYADYFCEHQSKEGHWYYPFNYYESKAPWPSALSQSRGVSVMIRAWLITKNSKYIDTAQLAISLFDTSVTNKGYLKIHPQTNTPYFEEYPRHTHPPAVLNGFMAALFGLWEMKHWTHDTKAGLLWRSGIESLEKMLPHYTLDWWTLYDLDPNSPIKNVNSYRYHLLILHYLIILNTIEENSTFQKYISIWGKQCTTFNKYKASLWKALRKILYR